MGHRAKGASLLGLFNCLRDGYAYGEPGSAKLERLMCFGAPTGEPTPEIRKLLRLGYYSAVALGLPDTWQPPGSY